MKNLILMGVSWLFCRYVIKDHCVGELGLFSHRPGGNAYNRQTYYRHPVYHSVKDRW